MTNVVLIARKLATLDEHLRRLRERRPDGFDAFERDRLLQDAVALGVLVIVQEATDIAFHMSSDEGWELAPTYREAFLVLARHGVIDEALALALGNAVQLRDRIAHGYATLDVERLWSELPSGVAAFARFSERVADFCSTR